VTEAGHEIPEEARPDKRGILQPYADRTRRFAFMDNDASNTIGRNGNRLSRARGYCWRRVPIEEETARAYGNNKKRDDRHTDSPRNEA
jgi:hypothetical protein